jgi:hypothetical protein
MVAVAPLFVDPAAPFCAPSAPPPGAPAIRALLDRTARIAPPAVEHELDREAIALLRGAATERRVLRLLLAGIVAATLPRWLLGARLGNDPESRIGIDVVVSCDDGDHALQVKSSRLGMLKFIGQRSVLSATQPRGLVVVLDEMPDRQVRGQVVAALNTLRLERRFAAEASR